MCAPSITLPRPVRRLQVPSTGAKTIPPRLLPASRASRRARRECGCAQPPPGSHRCWASRQGLLRPRLACESGPSEGGCEVGPPQEIPSERDLPVLGLRGQSLGGGRAAHGHSPALSPTSAAPREAVIAPVASGENAGRKRAREIGPAGGGGGKEELDDLIPFQSRLLLGAGSLGRGASRARRGLFPASRSCAGGALAMARGSCGKRDGAKGAPCWISGAVPEGSGAPRSWSS